LRSRAEGRDDSKRRNSCEKAAQKLSSGQTTLTRQSLKRFRVVEMMHRHAKFSRAIDMSCGGVDEQTIPRRQSEAPKKQFVASRIPMGQRVADIGDDD
jgi:hypothetical protein